MTNFIQRRLSDTKAISAALVIALVGQIALGTIANAAVVPSNKTAISTVSFSDNGGLTYSEVGGQPTGAGDFGNGAVAGYPEGACIPFFVELANNSNAAGDISVTLVHDYNNSGVIGVTKLESIAQNAGTLQNLPNADDLNDIAFSENEITSMTSAALAAGGSAATTVTGPYAGDEGDGTAAITATDTERHYFVTVQNIPADDSAYLFFCGRLGLDASEYPGASLSIGVSPPSGGVENTAIATNQVLALPSITLTKVVTGGDASADQWSFNVSPAVGNQTNFATTINEDLSASVTIENVSPDGSYTITESGPLNYDFVSGSGTNCSFSGSTATASVTAGKPAVNATCVFTNTYNAPPEPTTGTLTVYKDVTNDDGGNLGSGDFSINITDGDAYDNTFAGVSTLNDGTVLVLEAGSYTVSETAVSGYAGNFAACGSEGVISVTAGQNVDCTIVNDDIAPTLKVTKIVSGGDKAASEFTLLVDQTTVTSGVATAFSAGTYTVSEVNDPNYSAVISGDCALNGSITLALGDVKECTITNTIIVPPEETGTITVVKVVDNELGGNAEVSDFPLFIGATSVTSGETKTLPVGNYTVSETNEQANYVPSFSESCPQGSVSLQADEDVVCTITNTYVPPAPTTGNVTVTKVVINDDETASSQVSDFVLKVGETTVTSGATNAFAAGSYVISESGPTSGYAATFTGDCAPQGNLTVVAGQSYTCTITNDDLDPPPPEEPSNGTLTVVKVVINDNGGTASVSSFPLFIGEMSVTSGTPNSLPPGSYVVGETGSPDYVASFSGACDANGAVSLESGDEKTCTITNDDKPTGGSAPQTGTLVVVTKVINDDGGTALPASFTMTVGDGISVSSTFGGFDTPGISFGYAPGAYVVNGSTSPSYSQSKGANCSGTMLAGQTVTCVVTYDDIPTGGPTPEPPAEPPAPQPEPEAPVAPPAPVPQVLGATDSDLPVTGMPAWTLATVLLAASPFLRRKRA